MADSVRAKGAESATETAKPAEGAPGAKKPRGCVYIDPERCKGCGICVAFCPQKVLEMSKEFNKKGYHYPEAAQPDKCVGCDFCGHYCPDFAIHGERNIEKKESGDKE